MEFFFFVDNVALLDENTQAISQFPEGRRGNVSDDPDELFSAPAAVEVEGAGVVSKGVGDEFENLVPHIVSMGVVDGFEMVDVYEEDSKGNFVSTVLLESAFQFPFNTGPIGELGEFVKEGHFFQFLEPQLIADLFADIREKLYASHHVTAGIGQGRYPDGYGNRLTIFVVHVEFQFVHGTMAKCFGKWAQTLTKPVSFTIVVGEDVVVA